jgi:hypothetical protein
MSDLLTTTDGTNALIVAQQHLLKRRLSRFFKRNLVVSYNEWLQSNGFNLTDLLGQLNSAHDEEIINLYRLLALVGGLDVTITDIDVWIDSVNGSDTEGDGSETNPYQTMWFFYHLPRRINHVVNIMFTENYVVPSDDPFLVSFEFGDGGYLNFIGVGSPETVVAGLEVLTTGPLSSGAAQYIQMTTAVNDYPGEFLLVKDGLEAGQASPIHKRTGTDTYITIRGSYISLAVGDTCDIVRPSVHFECGALSIACRNSTWHDLTECDNGKVAFVNLQIDIVNTDQAGNCILVDSTVPTVFGFVQVNPPATATWLVKSEVNTQSALEETETISASGVTNIADIEEAANQRFAGLSIKEMTYGTFGYVEGGKLHWTSLRNVLTIQGDCKLYKISCEIFDARGANAYIQDCLAEGRAILVDANGGGIETWYSRLFIDRLMVLSGDNVISILSHSIVVCKAVERSLTYSTITGYGLYFESGGDVEIRDNGVNLYGTAGAIRFALVNPGVTAAMPGAYGWTSQHSGVVKRLST